MSSVDEPAASVTVTVNGTRTLPATGAVQAAADLVTTGLMAFVIGTETSTVGREPVYLTCVPLAMLDSGRMTGFVAAEPINLKV